MGKEFYFETDDRLDRKKYAEFLKTLLEHCDEYRREDSDGAYVIAIDSPWGTGKTRFAKMLRNYLENRTSKTPVDAPIDPTKGFLTVYYNAWDTDFSNDALEPLIYSLINSPELESELFEKQADEEIKNFIDSAKKVLKVIGLSAAHHLLGDPAAKVLSDCNDEKEQSKEGVCDFEKRRAAIADFKETLSRVIVKTSNNKLVIIIDELDRCRPNYAIQTLEIAKHLFDVKGLVFIFALDIKQLSCSVKTIYGLEMDAPGYLCRFFDYISQLPLPEMRKIIANCLDSYEVKGFFTAVLPINEKNKASKELGEFIYNIAINGSLSLREILTLATNYEIMMVTFLRKYNSIVPFMLYFFLLYLKLKYSDVYNSIITNKAVENNWANYLGEKLGKIIDTRIILDKLVLLNNKNKIKDIDFYVVESNVSDYKKSRSGVKIDSVDMTYSTKGAAFSISYMVNNNGFRNQQRELHFATESLDQILFFQDLMNWEQIKELTLPEYYHQQLEMFNFALPSEGTELQ